MLFETAQIDMLPGQAVEISDDVWSDVIHTITKVTVKGVYSNLAPMSNTSEIVKRQEAGPATLGMQISFLHLAVECYY